MKEHEFKNGIKKVGNKFKEFPKEHPMIFTLGPYWIWRNQRKYRSSCLKRGK